MQKLLFAATVTAGLAANEASACTKQPENPDHAYTVDMVDQKDVLPFTFRRLWAAGKIVTTDAEGNKMTERDPLAMRCFQPGSYEFHIPSAAFERAAKTGAVNISLDAKFDVAPSQQRACMAVPVRSVTVSGNKETDSVELHFTVDENLDMQVKRTKTIAKFDEKPRAEQVWCYSFDLK